AAQVAAVLREALVVGILAALADQLGVADDEEAELVLVGGRAGHGRAASRAGTRRAARAPRARAAGPGAAARTRHAARRRRAARGRDAAGRGGAAGRRATAGGGGPP